MPIAEAGKIFGGSILVEIGRKGKLIDSPRSDEMILPGDRLVFVGDVDEVAALHLINGLQSTADPQFKIDTTSLHFSEIVVSATSNFIGKTVKRIGFRSNLRASVIAIYRQGRRLVGNVADQLLYPGDSLMLLSAEPWQGAEGVSSDYYCVRYNKRVMPPRPTRVKRIAPLILGMFLFVIITGKILIAAMGTTLLLVATGCLTIREAKQGISWNLLLLIASAFAVGQGLQSSGVASFLAERMILLTGDSPYALIIGVYLISALFTECITNSAAVVLVFPIAMQAAALVGFDTIAAAKAIGVTVAIASSCSCITPIGYQTNTIV